MCVNTVRTLLTDVAKSSMSASAETQAATQQLMRAAPAV